MKYRLSYKKAKDLLDKVFSVYIRQRDKRRYNGICPICQKRAQEVCFHFLPRGNTAIRWDEDNCVASCRGCNWNEHLTRGQDKRDAKFREAHVRIIGEDRRKRLEAIKGQEYKRSAEELLDMKRYFEKLMEEIK